MAKPWYPPFQSPNPNLRRCWQMLVLTLSTREVKKTNPVVPCGRFNLARLAFVKENQRNRQSEPILRMLVTLGRRGSPTLGPILTCPREPPVRGASQEGPLIGLGGPLTGHALWLFTRLCL